MYILEIKVDTQYDFIKEYYESLSNKESSDSGIDLITPTSITINRMDIETIDFGIKCQMINSTDNKFYPYYLYPRSSISKTPLIMANCVGIIDRDYRKWCV